MPWQPDDVMFPDVEELLCDAFRTLLAAAGETVDLTGSNPAGITVDRKVPNPRPKRLVAIIRDGGQSNGLRDQPRIRFRIFDKSDAAANDLARKVHALSGLVVGDGVFLHRRHLSGPLEVPDKSTGPQRYLLIEFHTRGTPLT